MMVVMMATTNHTALGLLPSVNDVTAGLAILFVYTLRFITLGDPSISAPWYLAVTTDLLLPLLAGVWLWAYSMYLLLGR